MSTRIAGLVAVAGLMSTLSAGVGAQQALGTFRWQLQPFCNVVTLSVHQDSGVYTVDGYDDQCGAAALASVVGTAVLNPDSTIGLGLSGATAPGAAPVMLYARLDLATVSGTWSDSTGNSGTFVFTPGPGTGGSARPIPPNGIRPGSVTADQIAPGGWGRRRSRWAALRPRNLRSAASRARRSPPEASRQTSWRRAPRRCPSWGRVRSGNTCVG